MDLFFISEQALSPRYAPTAIMGQRIKDEPAVNIAVPADKAQMSPVYAATDEPQII